MPEYRIIDNLSESHSIPSIRIEFDQTPSNHFMKDLEGMFRKIGCQVSIEPKSSGAIVSVRSESLTIGKVAELVSLAESLENSRTRAFTKAVDRIWPEKKGY